jgi:hypothetical protein
MSLPVEVALIGAGAALLGSAVGYSGIRHQVRRQADQRLRELRLRAYTRALSTAHEMMNTLSFHRVPRWSPEPLRQTVLQLLNRQTQAISEARLVASAPVQDSLQVLYEAVADGATFAFDLITERARGPAVARIRDHDPLPVATAPGHNEVYAKLADAASWFVVACQQEVNASHAPRPGERDVGRWPLRHRVLELPEPLDVALTASIRPPASEEPG